MRWNTPRNYFVFAKTNNKKGVLPESKILSLPESFMQLLGKMHGVFTEPSFFYFSEFIKGILISSRKAVTKFYLLGDHDRHFTNYHRFLNRYKPNFSSWFMVLYVTSYPILHYKNAQRASPGTPALFVTQSVASSYAYSSCSTVEFRFNFFPINRIVTCCVLSSSLSPPLNLT